MTMEEKRLTGRWFVDNVRYMSSCTAMQKKLAPVAKGLHRCLLDSEEVYRVVNILEEAQENILSQNPRLKRVEIRLLGGEGGVAYADLEQEKIEQFVLKDASGEVIPLYCWSWWGVGYSDEKGFFTEESQEGFSLMYFLPDGVNAEDLVLSVEAGSAE